MEGAAAVFDALQNGTLLDSVIEQIGLTATILIVLGIGILIFLIVAIIAERKTRILFPERPKRPGEGGFLDFDDDDDDDDE